MRKVKMTFKSPITGIGFQVDQSLLNLIFSDTVSYDIACISIPI